MLEFLAVGFGGFIGSAARYVLGKMPLKSPVWFPVNTFLINVIGAFIIGCIAAIAAKNETLDPRLVLFIKVGICGGFTTFSTFSLEVNDLLKSGSVITALIYITASVVCSVSAVFLGQYIIK